MSDPTRDAELAREQSHVDRVYDRVARLREEAQRLQRDALRMARARTPGSLVERDAMAYHAAKRIQTLDTEYEGLVFGRLDLAGGEVRYIGRLGLRDANHESLVVDWRAPGAAPFYQATAEDPMGVVRRRVIRCAGPKVLDVSDDLLDAAAAGDAVAVVGDGALLATLARAKGERMRDIVTTIQREQDEAIRAPAGGVTLIEGGPGTGKTAVALHRAAHLLYRDRRRYEGGGVLLVGPSSVFMSYVDRVLPSLGEETAELRSLGEIVDGLHAERLDSPRLAALKGSLRMRRLLQRAARQEPPDAPRRLRIVYGGEVLRLEADELARVRRDLHARFPRSNATGPEARRGLVQALWGHRPEGVSWTTRQFARELYARDEFEQFAQAWWPIVAPGEVLARLSDPRRLREAARDAFSGAECDELARSFDPTGMVLTVADVALVDELRWLLGEPPPPPKRRQSSGGDELRELSTVAERYYAAPQRPQRPDNYDGYAHVLVDEAQDLSPMQWRMLGRRGQQASWTIVGDAAQSAWPNLGEASRARDEALRGKKVRRFHLTTNYRNSAEIFDYAARLVRRDVPDADLPVAVRRTGHEPEERTAGAAEFDAAVVAATADMLAAVTGTVGVVTPAARRDPIAEALAGLADADRVQVVDGMRAKGMEYDGVVVAAPEEIVAESPAGARVRYVALTRATQRLTTVAVARE